MHRLAWSGSPTAIALLSLGTCPGGVAQAAAPLNGAANPQAIPGQYIIVMKSAASEASKERTKYEARVRVWPLGVG
jgi:hypothetical protein